MQLAETVEFFTERVEQVWSQLPKLLRGADAEWYQHIHDELTAAGVPDELATRVAGFSSAFPTLDIVSVADRMGKEPLDVAEVYYDLADRLTITQLMDRISELPRADRWQSMARAAIREDLYAAHAALTADVLAVGNGTSTPEQRFQVWEQKNAAILGGPAPRWRQIRSSDAFDLANLSASAGPADDRGSCCRGAVSAWRAPAAHATPAAGAARLTDRPCRAARAARSSSAAGGAVAVGGGVWRTWLTSGCFRSGRGETGSARTITVDYVGTAPYRRNGSVRPVDVGTQPFRRNAGSAGTRPYRRDARRPAERERVGRDGPVPS
ncbi:hypothetical protein SFUMM280S_10413 [Streptomyces fumanus]